MAAKRFGPKGGVPNHSPPRGPWLGALFPSPAPLSGSGSAHNIRVLETNYDEFALLGDTITKGGDTFTMVTLYGRCSQRLPSPLPGGHCQGRQPRGSARDPHPLCFLVPGRQKQLRPELLAKFTQAALGQGLAQEDLLLLPRTGESARRAGLAGRAGTGLAGGGGCLGGPQRLIPFPVFLPSRPVHGRNCLGEWLLCWLSLARKCPGM